VIALRLFAHLLEILGCVCCPLSHAGGFLNLKRVFTKVSGKILPGKSDFTIGSEAYISKFIPGDLNCVP
jgi:hypothetical protein